MQTLSECLTDFIQKIGEGAYAHIEKFTGVTGQTINRWVQGRKIPQGENLLKIQYFLATIGYKVDRLEVSEEVDTIAKMIAFGVISPEEALEYLEYSSRDTLFWILFGKGGVSPERLVKMRELIEMSQTTLNEAVARLDSLRDELKLEAPDEQKVGATILRVVQEVDIRNDRDLMIETFADLLSPLQRLAEYFVSDECSPEDRERLRKRTGADGILHFANTIDKLCSETVRDKRINKK